jgi:hypothetical protein
MVPNGLFARFLSIFVPSVTLEKCPKILKTSKKKLFPIKKGVPPSPFRQQKGEPPYPLEIAGLVLLACRLGCIR